MFYYMFIICFICFIICFIIIFECYQRRNIVEGETRNSAIQPNKIKAQLGDTGAYR